MIVRRAGPDDATSWRAIRLLALRTAPEAFSSRYEDWCDRPLADFAGQIAANPLFLAFDQAEPIGSAAWLRDDLCPDRGWIVGVFVAVGWRRQGVSDALISAACTDAMAEGVTELLLEVAGHNDRAQAAYRRMGFEAIRRPEGLARHKGACDVTMRRSLIRSP